MDSGLLERRRPGPTGGETITKKCRICFQAETVRASADKRPVRGKERAPQSLLDRLWSALASGQADEEGDGFVAPCRCTGSMAWVHRTCLRIWRNKSPRRDSFYQCEQCFTPYRFKHTLLASLLANQFTIKLGSSVALVLCFMLSVMLMSLFIPGTAITHDYYAYGDYPSVRYAPQQQPRSVWTMPRTVEPKRFHPRRAPGGTVIGITQPTATTTTPPSDYPTEPTVRSTRRKLSRRAYTSLSPHSPISYLNVGYWITGHSLDEREDARNDFLAAILDVGMLELWPAAIALLAFLALVREGTQSSCFASCVLLVTTVLLYVADWYWAIWLYPVPAGYGLIRFALYTDDAVDSLVNTFVKWTSSELEDLT